MKTHDMKTHDRRWLILKIIPRRGSPISTREILNRLQSEHSINTDIRTIQRDLEYLADSGIFSIVSDGKNPAGWSWSKYAEVLYLPAMDPLVALTFRLVRDTMTRLLPRAALASLNSYFHTASERLKKMTDYKLSHWPDKVRVVSRSLNFEAPKVDEAVLNSLYESLQQEQCFELEYRVRSGKYKKYVVNPLGLVFVDNLIYLVATLYDYTDVKQLLAHRMKSIRLLPDRPATTLSGFTLQDYIDSGEFGYPLGGMIQLKSLFDKGAATYLYETKLAPNQKLSEQSDGKLLLEVTVRDDVKLRRWLKGFGDQVEVVEPADLRNEFVELARELANKYLPDEL